VADVPLYQARIEAADLIEAQLPEDFRPMA